ncbi:MAG: hypothetical protein IJV77_06635 [Clostridia bacterium]|nr:hypothetical protein [Clostridia bacterium]
MLKHKFYKNLFQTISYFSVIMIFVIFLLIGFFESLSYGPNFGWILLIISISLIVLFFLIGFYWIFQMVFIDESGIKILFKSRIVKQLKWEEIDTIEEANIMRNPALRIKAFDGNEIHLDKRKPIVKAIEIYSQKKIK